MSRRITFKLSGPKLEAAIRFADTLGMDLNLVAERALFYALRQAYSSEDTNDRTPPPNASGDIAETGQGAGSGAPLADTSDVASPEMGSQPG